MKKNNRFLILISASLFFAWPQVAKATDFLCPKKIGYIKEVALNQSLVPLMQTVYQKLGCTTDFIALPGKRGLAAFNADELDGELSRLEIVENNYKIDFLRSKQAIVHLKNSIWRHPDETIFKNRALGYYPGVIWHRHYVESYDGPAVAFNSSQNLFRAYKKRSIGSFLSSQIEVQAITGEAYFFNQPKVHRVLQTQGMYHYLNKRYAEFMKRFDDYIQTHKPFQNFKAAEKS